MLSDIIIETEPTQYGCSQRVDSNVYHQLKPFYGLSTTLSICHKLKNVDRFRATTDGTRWSYMKFCKSCQLILNRQNEPFEVVAVRG